MGACVCAGSVEHGGVLAAGIVHCPSATAALQQPLRFGLVGGEMNAAPCGPYGDRSDSFSAPGLRLFSVTGAHRDQRYERRERRGSSPLPQASPFLAVLPGQETSAFASIRECNVSSARLTR